MAHDPKLVRQRLRDDYKFYSKHALKIRTKDATVVPFTWNEAQTRLSAIVEEQYARTGKVRIIILKARQMGLSTWVGGRLLFRVSQRPLKKALVVTHESKATRALLDMTHRFHKLMPELLKLPTEYASRTEIKWSVPHDSGYVVGTAGGDTVARGETITHAHLSEVGLWPASSAAEIFAGLMAAVPDKPDTEVYIESTARGVTGVFYDTWKASCKGETDFIPVFLPWFVEPGYRNEPSPDFERTPEEERMSAEHGLDDHQLMFRRLLVAKHGRDYFMQEYPSTADEAFLTSGRPVFDNYLLNAMKARVPAPVEQLALEGTDPRTAKWERHSRGELLAYRKLDPNEDYFIGADIAQGIRGGDYSVASVLDSERRQVAVWHGHIEPHHFADVLYALGKRYNNALIIPENNNFGHSTCYALSKTLNYPRLFQEVITDKTTDKETTRLGFNTNVKSKTGLVDKLRASLRQDQIEILDKETLEEMSTYIVTPTGKMEAEAGKHDDRVIALALANHVVERRWAPVENVDEYFVTFEE